MLPILPNMVNAGKSGPRDLQFIGTIDQIVQKLKLKFKQYIRNQWEQLRWLVKYEYVQDSALPQVARSKNSIQQPKRCLQITRFFEIAPPLNGEKKILKIFIFLTHYHNPNPNLTIILVNPNPNLIAILNLIPIPEYRTPMTEY